MEEKYLGVKFRRLYPDHNWGQLNIFECRRARAVAFPGNPSSLFIFPPSSKRAFGKAILSHRLTLIPVLLGCHSHVYYFCQGT